MRPMDELWVISNGRNPESRKIVLGTIGNRPNIGFIEEDPTDQLALIESGWKRARGVRLLFLADKDLIVRGALDLIRLKGEEYDDAPLLFLSDKDDVLVPYNEWPGAADRHTIISKQGDPIKIPKIIVLRDVQIYDSTIQSIPTPKRRTPSRA